MFITKQLLLCISTLANCIICYFVYNYDAFSRLQNPTYGHEVTLVWKVEGCNLSKLSADEIVDGEWVARKEISLERKKYLDVANKDARRVYGLVDESILRADGKCGTNYVLQR